jgi:uncharacterized membrane protein (DUF2068 family)
MASEYMSLSRSQSFMSNLESVGILVHAWIKSITQAGCWSRILWRKYFFHLVQQLVYKDMSVTSL